MPQAEPIVPFDWQRILFSEQMPVVFLWEVLFRSLLMYLLILLTLRITGKRGVKQLSLFELTIILSLGSAAGDAMFYPDVPLIHVGIVFGVVIMCYLFFNWLTEKSRKAEQWLEGKAACIVQEGEINLQVFLLENLTYQELFGEIRQHHVEHLGQVRRLYLEATGEISLFFYPPEAEVRPGLPILPELISQPLNRILKSDLYACRTCGHCQYLEPTEHFSCHRCGKSLWLPASRTPRIS
jgi:uncharacterized membrane protein YcaP (DUF421 family)